jgi:RNA polymerase sigma factor (sigma-70 family)
MTALPASRAYWSKMRRRITLQTGDSQGSEDLMHTAIVRLLDSPADYDEPNPQALLLRIARNIEIDRWRSEQRNVVHRSGFLHHSQSQTLPRPDDIFEERTLLRRTLETLGQLPERRRAIFWMRQVDGLSIKEIAERFQISVSAVDKHLVLARQFLANWLKQEDGCDAGAPL